MSSAEHQGNRPKKQATTKGQLRGVFELKNVQCFTSLTLGQDLLLRRKWSSGKPRLSTVSFAINVFLFFISTLTELLCRKATNRNFIQSFYSFLHLITIDSNAHYRPLDLSNSDKQHSNDALLSTVRTRRFSPPLPIDGLSTPDFRSSYMRHQMFPEEGARGGLSRTGCERFERVVCG